MLVALVLGGAVVALLSLAVVGAYAGEALALTAALLLSVLSGQWGYLGLPLPLDRVAFAFAFVLVGVRLLRGRRLPWLGAAHLLLATVVVYAVGSAAASGTLGESQPTFLLLDQLGVVPLALLVVGSVAFATAGARRVLLGGLVLLGAYLGFTATMETIGARALVLPSFINDPSIGITAERARGPFLEAGTNGLAMFVCVVACVIAWGVWRRALARVGLAAVVALLLVGIVGTVTRQVWVGAALGGVVALTVHAPLRRWLLPAVAAAVVASVVALLAVPGLSDRAGERANTDRSVWDRLNSNRAALAMAEERPLLGWGWGTFPRVSRDHYVQLERYPVTSVAYVHNLPLSITAELGLVGLALWGGAFLAVLAGALGRRGPPDLEPWRYGLTAVAIAWLVVANLSPLTTAFPHALLWLWAGVVYGVNGERASARLRAPRIDRRWVRPIAAAAVLGAVGVAAGLARPPVHTAEARVTAGPSLNATQSLPGYDETVRTLAPLYARLATSPRVLRRAAGEEGLTLAEARDAVEASEVPLSSVAVVRARRPSVAGARRLARAVARATAAEAARQSDRAPRALALLQDYRGAERRAVAARERADATTARRDRDPAAVSARERREARLRARTLELRADRGEQRYVATFAPDGQLFAGAQIVGDAPPVGSDRASWALGLGLLGALLGVVLGVLSGPRALRDEFVPEVRPWGAGSAERLRRAGVRAPPRRPGERRPGR